MDDKRLESIIGTLLRVGVLLAASIVFVGGFAYLVQNHDSLVSYRVFMPSLPQARTLAGIVRSAARFNSEGLIQFGLLLLIATPVARVALALVGFALERDRLYAGVSFIVLAILVYSLMHAT
ncbi:MAG TPA: DUF1634 domain-containing protein [Terracidiphilus sp.]|jgi:uncharacterized membrane protein|nr:DUF1634 domain-containing protein [Terracidiphilus sp.]